MTGRSTIFADEIFTATDLNRRTGQVLDEAKIHPVTITRNEEAFALLLRKDASRMVETVSNANSMVDLATAISIYRQAGTSVPAGHAFEWINAFDMDELRDLLNEVYGAFRSAMDAGTSWNDFEAVLHEWHERAIALRSDALAAAFATPVEEVPLTPPMAPVECGGDV